MVAMKKDLLDHQIPINKYPISKSIVHKSVNVNVYIKTLKFRINF